MVVDNKYRIGEKNVLCVLALFLLLFHPVVSQSANETATGVASEGPGPDVELNFELQKSDYQYKIEDRADPFIPFFTGETTNEPTLDPNEIVESEERLTGMQLFEPGQLTLVGLMKAKGKFVAMVEDFTGKGYIISVGTKIGRRGVVKAIQPNKVLIEEVAVTRSGKELRSEIVMALRKEGEE